MLSLTFAGLGGCGGDDDSQSRLGPCDVSPPAIASCGGNCVPGTAGSCAPGMYCSADGLCTADCFADPATDPNGDFACPGGEVCTADGRCPSLATASTLDGSGVAGGAGNSCPAVDLAITRPKPKVVLAIDQSASMKWPVDGSSPANRPTEPSRYDEMVLAMLGDGTAGDPGVLRQFEAAIQMNAVFWTGRGDGDPDECPAVEQDMPLAYNNVAAIDSRMRELQALQDQRGIFAYTPTPESLNVLRQGVLADLTSTPEEPVSLLLVTDGGPDLCADREARRRGDIQTLPPFEPVSQMTADRLRTLLGDQSIRTYVIGFAGAGLDATRGDFNRQLKIMANGGQGYSDYAGLDGNPGPSADFIRATNRGELIAALQGLFGDQLSCTVPFNGARILDTSRACEGQVELNDRTLDCRPVGTDAASGWRVLPDGTALEVLGSDCDALKAAADVNLRAFGFPCEVAGLI
ncbi:MAG: hypothetical protein ACPGUV_00185 [Polyangiales bacterium]